MVDKNHPQFHPGFPAFQPVFISESKHKYRLACPINIYITNFILAYYFMVLNKQPAYNATST